MGKITVHKTKNEKGLMPRVIRTPGRIFRVCAKVCSLALILCVLNTTFVPSVSHAIETTKASGLVLEKGQDSNSSLTSPLSRNSDRRGSNSRCLSLLSASKHVPPKHAFDAGSRQHAGKAAVPVALGLFLGVRIALIPSPASTKGQKRSRNVQIGPEIRGISSNGNSRALAVAAYRKCQKEEFLKAGYNNK